MEMASILKPNGLMLIIEPKFHVTKAAFSRTVETVKAMGLTVVESPKVFLAVQQYVL